ncbi:DNA-(apurinic or apyrimidinic site) lyase 2 [Trichinella papuae]|uniref:DNA-(apurinic or apyrimidinic site) endonuclease n=1 Tax=Trichinella papuae TaxID=268474 RepID=A0A0V1MM57_9BILA|nr:DNA-(apurinic or apyrimidinic site) lyase 2 [Trichinella papuae]
MKIATWNVNGLRSIVDLQKTLLALDCDIICLQETKLSYDTLDSSLALIDGFDSYFAFCQVRRGYSGVATYCKSNFSPDLVFNNFHDLYQELQFAHPDRQYLGDFDDFDLLDNEGRVLASRHKLTNCSKAEFLFILNVYCPRVDPEQMDRQNYRLAFLKLLQHCTECLLNSGNYVLILGDMNLCHKRIDHCDPDQQFDTNEARIWLCEFLYDSNENSDGKMVDLYRLHYPDKVRMFTCWNTQKRARILNYGTRIDYILANVDLIDQCNCCEILSTIQGSDHCPVIAELSTKISAANVQLQLSSRKRFASAGTQLSLLTFLKTNNNNNNSTIAVEKNNDDTDDQLVLLNESVRKRKIRKCLTLKDLWSTKDNTQPTVSSVSSVTAEVNADGEVEDVVEVDAEEKLIRVENWKKLFGRTSQPRQAPLCKGHGERCVLRSVKKAGKNLNRKFYCCARPVGFKDDKQSRCDHFQWAD